ncbi:hypothetical protein GCM10012278_34540 [Nonomuraea glycinis]|uniref:Uncharacterized protein n=1 Tax=Nonomuraea glycinis TaxID=2047744 RepID=A0A918A5Z6_9ACTN|nr:hypothetical protein GCM10012278_34540 [Nonomuraea glycinis]
MGFQPPFDEGHQEAMEYASGRISLIGVAADYRNRCRLSGPLIGVAAGQRDRRPAGALRCSVIAPVIGITVGSGGVS